MKIVTEQKINRYLEITKKAFEKAKKATSKNREKEASEILKMVSCYINDSVYFKDKKDFVNSFAAVNYAHGWLDAGARLKIFRVRDKKLFTI